MHVHCPVCSTQYDIPPLLRPRRLRCAQCGGEWREVPAPQETDQPTPEEPGPAVRPGDAVATGASLPQAPPPEAVAPVADRQIASIAASARTPAGPLLWSVLWAISLLLIAGCLASLWHWRGAVGHRWPPSLWLYRLLPGGVAG
jgi:hypothetical protein